MNGKEGELPDETRDEIFRLNCIEITSESGNPKFEEYPILFVDNALKDDDFQEYEDYLFYGRNGMPRWKDYYAIKSLAETLEEIDGLENKEAITTLQQVEESFLSTLYSRFKIDRQEISPKLRSVLFAIIQKLELFYPDNDKLLGFLLKVDYGLINKTDLENAQKQFDGIFKDDHYFTVNELLFIKASISYFDPSQQTEYKSYLKKMSSEVIQEELTKVLSQVKLRDL